MFKKIVAIVIFLVGLVQSLCFANLTADQIRELNQATPGTFKVQLGTVLSAEQALIDTNITNISSNTVNIATNTAKLDDTTVDFLTTDDTSLSLTNVAYVRKYTGAIDEGINLGAGASQQIVTFALAVESGGNFEITPDTSSGFSQVTLSATGDNATLRYVDATVGWVLMGLVTSDTGGGVTGPVNPFN